MKNIYIVGLLMVFIAGMVGCASAATQSSTLDTTISSSAILTLTTPLTLTGGSPGGAATVTDANFVASSNTAFALTAETAPVTGYGTADTGQMMNSAGTKLSSKLQVKWTSGSNDFVEMTGSALSLNSGNKKDPGSYTAGLILSNAIAWTDAPDTYKTSLTIILTPD
ncbi:MAG: hypothetical protein PHQ34_08280 [Methanothrix sp.]|nr:hypothetical protein [Methanothrix sp.]